MKILRIYGQEIERKVFPVPDKVTSFRSKRVAVQLKADEDLKDVSLHHVIRSGESPFAKQLKEYDEEFRTFRNSNAPRQMIDDFNKVTTSRLRPRLHGTGFAWSRHRVRVDCGHIYSHHISL